MTTFTVWNIWKEFKGMTSCNNEQLHKIPEPMDKCFKKLDLGTIPRETALSGSSSTSCKVRQREVLRLFPGTGIKAQGEDLTVPSQHI